MTYSPSISIKVQNFTDGWKLGILIFARAKRLAQHENRVRTKTQTKPYQKEEPSSVITMSERILT